MMLSLNDLAILKKKGVSETLVQQQLSNFVNGFPFLKIVAPATVSKGVMKLSLEQEGMYISEWDKSLKEGLRVTKFVPASGAASRMFKDLYSFLDASYDVPTTEVEKRFFERIKDFAFYEDLDAVCLQNVGQNIEDLLTSGQYKEVVRNLLLDVGLNYGKLPKGMLQFHKYNNGSTRTPIEEHLQEGAMYAASEGDVNLHFTVSPEHRVGFEEIVAKSKGKFEVANNVHYNVSFSVQKPQTDTVAVDMDNKPFKVDGDILFRPGGHGSLIENLNDIDADVVFVKNIDNVVPDALKKEEKYYKKILGGVLIHAQKQTFYYLNLLNKGEYDNEMLLEMLYFLQNTFNVKNLDTKYLEDAELAVYIKNKLNRPIRVCGMVKNEGEPGGGPYLVESKGVVSLQILESSQIDFGNKENENLVKNSTHFNPVDLVCGVKNYKGEKFDLREFVDPDTGFISEKTMNGRKLKALELPGLWNGAMSDWNTIFVEVPIATFNPVKMVTDLLRDEHSLK